MPPRRGVPIPSWKDANKFGKQFRFYNQYLIRILDAGKQRAKRCARSVVIALADKDLYDVSSRVVPVFIIWEGN